MEHLTFPKNYIDQNFVPKTDVAQSYTSKSAVQPISAPLAAEMKEDIETLKQQVKSLQESMKEETA